MVAEETDPELTLEQRINLETARISWTELQRQFAQGVLIVAEGSLDLVQTAADFIDDRSDKIQRLMGQGRIRKAEMEDARRWELQDAELWAVVAAPWVLVQEIEQQGTDLLN